MATSDNTAYQAKFAKSMLLEAKELREEFQPKIDEGIKRGIETYKAECDKTHSQVVEKATLKATASNLASASALALYSAILTLIWLSDHASSFKTVPQWFVNRANNLSDLWEAVLSVYKWGYRLFPVTWLHEIRAAIPILILIGISLALFVGLVVLFMHLKQYGLRLIGKYKSASVFGLKISVSLSFVMASIPLSVLITELWKTQTFNVLSWWLLLSITFNTAYHVWGYKNTQYSSRGYY